MLNLDNNRLLDDLLVHGCAWVQDYLEKNPNVSESDRHLCDDVPKIVAKDNGDSPPPNTGFTASLIRLNRNIIAIAHNG